MKKVINTFAVLMSLVVLGLNTSCSTTSSYETLIVGLWQYDSHICMEFTSGGSVIAYENGNVVGTETYSINNNSLILRDGAEYHTCTIVSLTHTYLELDVPNGGNTERLVFKRIY